MGMPLPVAYTVCFVEFLSGIGLIVGFLARLCAIGVAAVMIGAMASVHWQHGFFLNVELKPGKGHGIEYNLALLAMALAVLIEGGGAFWFDLLLVGWGGAADFKPAAPQPGSWPSRGLRTAMEFT